MDNRSLLLHWVLVWLQSWALMLAVAAITQGGRLFCRPEDVRGLCACSVAVDYPECWRDHVVYRVEAAAFLTYLTLALWAFFGKLEQYVQEMSCLAGAMWALAVTLFIPLLAFGVFFWLPNELMVCFSYVAVGGAAFSRLLQVLLWLDFSYDMGNKPIVWANDQHRRHFSSTRKQAVKHVSTAIALLLLVGSLAGTGYLMHQRPGLGWLFVPVVVVGLLGLLVGITDWCPHGSLLCGSLMLCYLVWLSFEVTRNWPIHDEQLALSLSHSGVFLLFVTLAYYAVSFGVGNQVSGQQTQLHLLSEGCASVDPPKDLVQRCLVHAAASCYLAMNLAYYQSKYRGWVCVGVIVMSCVMYVWTLVAPKVLPDRSFGSFRS